MVDWQDNTVDVEIIISWLYCRYSCLAVKYPVCGEVLRPRLTLSWHGNAVGVTVTGVTIADPPCRARPPAQHRIHTPLPGEPDNNSRVDISVRNFALFSASFCPQCTAVLYFHGCYCDEETTGTAGRQRSSANIPAGPAGHLFIGL